MIDLLGFVAANFLATLMISSIAIYAKGDSARKSIAAGLAAAWFGIAAGAASAGITARSHPFPLIGLFLLTPLIAALVATQFRSVRDSLRPVPLWLLVGLNAGRIFAILFLVLDQVGRLAGPFAFYAGWGDILTGVVAVPIAIALHRATSHSRGFWIAVLLWNLFGVADLVNAIFLGVTSSVGSPLEIFHHPPGSAAMQHLPFSLVPTVLVPFYLIVHAAIWIKASQELQGEHSAR